MKNTTPTSIDRANGRLKAVENTDRLIARMNEQLTELKELRKQWDAELLAGTSDLYAATAKHEGELIRFALRAAKGRVTNAGRLLGIDYQALAYIIESRHPELLKERSPIRRRKART